MNRSELEHIIRASGSISGDDEIIILGSQAILGQFPDSPHSLLVSMEADVVPKNLPEKADLIDGSIGEASLFQQNFGYYAHGISLDTATLPRGWQERLVKISNANTRGVTGWCLEVHDLALSKYAAGREKDLRFTRDLLTEKLVDPKTLIERLELMPLDRTMYGLIKERITRDIKL